MLTKGDLVKIRQHSFLYPASSEPWLVKKLKKTGYGIVINKTKKDETKVFFENQTWVINDKCLQLIGNEDVYKTA